MTEEEFRRELEEFWSWVSKRDRAASHWFLSLEEWASERWNEAFDKEKKERQ